MGEEMKRLVALVILGALVLGGCDFRSEYIAPVAGTIVDTPTATVTGTVPGGAPAGGTITVNGVTGTWDGDNWSAVIPMDTDTYVTPVTAIYTAPNNNRYIQESTLIHGEKIDDGEFSPGGVGMLFTNGGIAGLGPVINTLAGDAFDISAQILAQDPLIPPTDAGLGVTITGRAYEAGAESVNVGATSTNGGVETPITVTNLYIGLDLTLSGLLSGPCKLEIEVPTTSINATFDFAPTGGELDVNMVGQPGVSLAGVSYEFISGICDPGTPLLGSIINSAAGDAIEQSIRDGFVTQLGDPDGTGPQDSPIADSIDTALANVNIAGAVGEAVKANLDAPFIAIDESATGIDFRSDADFHATFGTGPADCLPPAGAPDFTSSFDVAGTYPSLGATTPGGGVPYGLALVTSSSAFNQLLSSMTECGLLNQDMSQITLGGTTLPVTSTVLAAIVPEFATKLPPNTPLIIRLDPQAAPFLTDAPSGPNGETAELFLADLRIEFIQRVPVPGGGTSDRRWLSLSVDAPLGFEMGFDPAAGQLSPTITPPSGGQVTTRVHANELGTNEAALEHVFSQLFPNFVSGLGAGFGAFPLPSFLGMDLQVLEIARHGNYFGLYANLVPQLQTRLENVVVTDLSTPDFAEDAVLFDSWEWRHRLRRQVSADEVHVNLDGVVGADACCPTGDRTTNAHAGYRISFDVVPASGDTWRLDLSHLIRGAHTANDEGFAARTNISTITGRYRLDGGAWQGFAVGVGADGPGDGTPGQGGPSGSAFNEAFLGSATTSVQGTTATSVEVEFGFDVSAFSDANLLFPTDDGSEAAVRFGANDSLTNDFTAGDYPGSGNRNITQDGHFGSITLTTVP
ncbi:MAG TPA: hypothetical protein VKD21_09910 [Acidimicrobiales bacterium]|nr:hypothetical protein [Acidimicrobiales bacterium]